MAAVDVTGVVSGIAEYAVPIGLVGSAVLLLYALQQALVWVRQSLGVGSTGAVRSVPEYVGGGGLISSAEEFKAIYGPDVNDPNDIRNYDIAPPEANPSDDGFQTAIAAQRAAMQDMAPGAQGSLFVSSGEGYGITVGTSGGSSYYSDDADFDLDPSSLSDSQRRAMMG